GELVAGKVHHEHLAGLVLKMHGGHMELFVFGQQLAELGVLVTLRVNLLVLLPEELTREAGALELGEKIGYTGSEVSPAGIFDKRFWSRIDQGRKGSVIQLLQCLQGAAALKPAHIKADGIAGEAQLPGYLPLGDAPLQGKKNVTDKVHAYRVVGHL